MTAGGQAVRRKVRIYRWHDPDLLSLHATRDFDLAREMRKALRAYVRGTPLVIYVPRDQKPYAPSRDAEVILYLREDDRDVLDFLAGIRSGCRCAAVKAIFRSYLEYANVGPLAAGNREPSAEGAARAREGRRPPAGPEAPGSREGPGKGAPAGEADEWDWDAYDSAD